MSLVPNKALEGAAGNQGYKLQRSLRFRSSASAYLDRTLTTPTNNKIYTWSGWVKKSVIGTTSRKVLFSARNGTSEDYLAFDDSTDNLRFFINSNNASTTAAYYRDPSAWYHVVLAVDTTQATAANRVNIYVNGSLAANANGTAPTQNSNTTMNGAYRHIHGRCDYNSAWYFDGYLAEVNFIDGQALTPSSFGETDTATGVWKPKKYGGSYGTNGFYLPFSDNTSATTLAYDKSGNGNNWTPNNISTTAGATYDSMTDVPTLTSATAANFATLNPLALRRDVATTVTFADGNLKATFNNAGGNTTHAWGTIAPITGKFYWEITASAVVSNLAIGIGDQADQDATANHSSIYVPAGGIYKYGTLLTTAASYTTNDVIGLAYDVDAGTLAYYKNNALQYTVTGLTYIPSLPFNRGSTSDVIIANFGQRPFSYTPPTGFKALNTFNLPDPTIKKPNQYMDATLWTGDQSARTITNSGNFQPDLVWTKSRSDAENHRLHDSVRSGNGTVLYELNSNLTEADGTDTLVSGMVSNGFTIASGANSPNITGRTYVGWQWKKGATPGFDIVTYTGNGTAGRTVNHSLGVAPSMIIVKGRSNVDNWQFGHTSVGWNGFLYFNLTNAYTATSSAWNNTAPTSTVFSLGSDTRSNGNGTTYVAYVFAAIPGMSAFGSYVGNSYSGGADGTFVYLGFKPKYVMVKMTSSSGYDWVIYDSARNTTNVAQNYLLANQSYSENAGGTVADIDFLSNGFKLRNSGSSAQSTNIGNQTYIYAAFAENPFKYSNAR